MVPLENHFVVAGASAFATGFLTIVLDPVILETGILVDGSFDALKPAPCHLYRPVLFLLINVSVSNIQCEMNFQKKLLHAKVFQIRIRT